MLRIRERTPTLYPSVVITLDSQLSLSQTHFWKNGRMTLTLPKWGLGNPLGLSKLQSLIAGVKTPRIEVFFISLKNYQSVDVENGLA
jgi:hypothetical protein